MRGMQESAHGAGSPPPSFCSECGRKLAPHWKFCAGCGQSVSASALPSEPSSSDLDALLRATAAAKHARLGVPGLGNSGLNVSGVGERTVSLTRASDGATFSVTDLNVTLMGTPPIMAEAERAYRRGLEAARAFERSQALPRPRERDYSPALIVFIFALVTALAIGLVFYFMQHF